MNNKMGNNWRSRVSFSIPLAVALSHLLYAFTHQSAAFGIERWVEIFSTITIPFLILTALVFPGRVSVWLLKFLMVLMLCLDIWSVPKMVIGLGALTTFDIIRISVTLLLYLALFLTFFSL